MRFLITNEEFQRISVYMKQNYGIDLSQKKVIVNGRLQKHMRTGGWKSVNKIVQDLLDLAEVSVDHGNSFGKGQIQHNIFRVAGPLKRGCRVLD